MKPQCVTIQMKAIEQYFHVLLSVTCKYFSNMFFAVNSGILRSESTN